MREQVAVLEQKIQQVQLDKTIKEIGYSQMEQAKQEMEDRLTEQVVFKFFFSSLSFLRVRSKRLMLKSTEAITTRPNTTRS
jgi:hypothetical protein